MESVFYVMNNVHDFSLFSHDLHNGSLNCHQFVIFMHMVDPWLIIKNMNTFFVSSTDPVLIPLTPSVTESLMKLKQKLTSNSVSHQVS